MSSAILYLAIVAIWACVLIPRWLRRDSVRGAVTGHEAAVHEHEHLDDHELSDAELGDDGDVAIAGLDGGREADAGVPPLTAAESRHRMLAARRRLLGMLVVLEVAAIALAVFALAAMWVVIPPTLMLAGYVLLLREASKADAERAAWEAERAAHEAAMRAKARARARAEQRGGERAERGAAAVPTQTSAAALAARFAAAPVAADYEDGGRDFAPGLSGKYTTSHEDYEYPQRRLRAVGD
jgi:hypothetical protein